MFSKSLLFFIFEESSLINKSDGFFIYRKDYTLLRYDGGWVLRFILYGKRERLDHIVHVTSVYGIPTG